jgi:hypothetical protein
MRFMSLKLFFLLYKKRAMSLKLYSWEKRKENFPSHPIFLFYPLFFLFFLLNNILERVFWIYSIVLTPKFLYKDKMGKWRVEKKHRVEKEIVLSNLSLNFRAQSYLRFTSCTTKISHTSLEITKKPLAF